MSIHRDTQFVSVTGEELRPEDQARLLTEDEINDILNVLSPSIGGTLEVRELGLYYQKEALREKLKTLPISPKAIALVKEEIRRQYDMAKVFPHKPVGIRCAEAFIATVMQATLNTRHKAGAGIDVGFDAVREVIFMPQHRKVEMTMCHFLEKKTKDEILDMRAEIVYRNIWHFVDDYMIDNREALPDYWWCSHQRSMVGLGDISEKRPFMRLILNVPMMIEYKMTMVDIVNGITTKSEDGYERIRCIYGPISSGILDVYPTEAVFESMISHFNISTEGENESEEAEILYEYFLDQNIRRALMTKHTLVRGYEDIEALYFASTPIISAILSHERIPDGDNGEIRFYIKKKRSVYFFQGVRDGEVHEFIEKLGGTIEHDSDMPDDYDYSDYKDEYGEIPDNTMSSDDRGFMIISFPKGTKGKTLEDIYSNVQEEQLVALKEIHDKWTKKKNDWERKNPNQKYEEDEPSMTTEISNYSEHNYAILYTSNLSRVLALPGVDRSRTYCNNFHEMTRTLGSEAARAYHLYNCFQVMNATKSSINPRYLEFFSNVVFQRGTPMGITFTGISKQTGGWFSRAAIEQSVKVLVEASCFGKKGGESTTNVATAVGVGNMARSGTGAGRYRLPAEVYEPKEINDEDFDPSAILKGVREKKSKAGRTDDDGFYDMAENEADLQYENLYNGIHKASNHLDIRVDKFENKPEGVSLSKLQRIIDRRDYVGRDTPESPSVIGPDDIEKLPILKIYEIPEYVKEVLMIGSNLGKLVRLPKIAQPPQVPIVSTINVTSFLDLAKGNIFETN